jgi:hypothetical protein
MVRHFEIPDAEEETGTVASEGASR